MCIYILDRLHTYDVIEQAVVLAVFVLVGERAAKGLMYLAAACTSRELAASFSRVQKLDAAYGARLVCLASKRFCDADGIIRGRRSHQGPRHHACRDAHAPENVHVGCSEPHEQEGHGAR